jgi:hypothetical protein
MRLSSTWGNAAMTISALTPRTAILIGLTAAGLFVAGFGYGYASPPDDGGFDDSGHPAPHGTFRAKFLTRPGRACDEPI